MKKKKIEKKQSVDFEWIMDRFIDESEELEKEIERKKRQDKPKNNG